jgi:DNA-binding NarL/FixJ family response regulator
MPCTGWWRARSTCPTPSPKPTRREQNEQIRERIESLTPQQRIVLNHLVHGRLNKQIAHDLSVSMTTVKAHVSAILLKLNVFSRTQAVILANRVQFDGD